jgi:hypothetical protein
LAPPGAGQARKGAGAPALGGGCSGAPSSPQRAACAGLWGTAHGRRGAAALVEEPAEDEEKGNKPLSKSASLDQPAQVPLEDIEKVINYYEIYYFQDEQMAREIQSSFEIGQEEIVDLGNYSYKLPVFATLEKVNIIDYVPKVLDF